MKPFSYKCKTRDAERIYTWDSLTEFFLARMSSPWLFNLYAEYIMQKPGLDASQAGIKIAGRNINNLRYSDDTTLMAEREEELKSLLMRVKEESENASLKLNIKKKKQQQ